MTKAWSHGIIPSSKLVQCIIKSVSNKNQREFRTWKRVGQELITETPLGKQLPFQNPEITYSNTFTCSMKHRGQKWCQTLIRTNQIWNCKMIKLLLRLNWKTDYKWHYRELFYESQSNESWPIFSQYWCACMHTALTYVIPGVQVTFKCLEFWNGNMSMWRLTLTEIIQHLTKYQHFCWYKKCKSTHSIQFSPL
jgi:hypothetical protein